MVREIWKRSFGWSGSLISKEKVKTLPMTGHYQIIPKVKPVAESHSVFVVGIVGNLWFQEDRNFNIPWNPFHCTADSLKWKLKFCLDCQNCSLHPTINKQTNQNKVLYRTVYWSVLRGTENVFSIALLMKAFDTIIISVTLLKSLAASLSTCCIFLSKA